MFYETKKENTRLFESLDMFSLALLDADPASLVVEIGSLFGQDVVLKLVEIFGGSVIRVPTKEQIQDAVRNACVWRDFSAGKSVSEICEEYSLHHKTVYAIVDRFKTFSSVKDVVDVERIARGE